MENQIKINHVRMLQLKLTDEVDKETGEPLTHPIVDDETLWEAAKLLDEFSEIEPSNEEKSSDHVRKFSHFDQTRDGPHLDENGTNCGHICRKKCARVCGSFCAFSNQPCTPKNAENSELFCAHCGLNCTKKAQNFAQNARYVARKNSEVFVGKVRSMMKIISNICANKFA